MRIALISLARQNGCPPIGLVYLATYIKSKLDVGVEIIDYNWQQRWTPVGYDIICISAMTIYYELAKKIGWRIKKDFKTFNISVIIGGVHISTCPESFDPDAFDAMVIGEGEKSLEQIINEYIKYGRLLKQVYQHAPIENLDDLPRPDWDLVDKRYFDKKANMTFGEYGISGVMLTSRGCPYRCRFCATQKFWGNKVRFHSAEYVKCLIFDLWDKGVTHIQIWDDLFTINKERLKEIAPLIKLPWRRIKFNCQPRTDLIDGEMCKLLKDIGVTTCLFGFESGSDRVLKYLKRDTCTVQDNYKAIEICHRHGLKVQGSVMLGSPSETLEDMEKTYDFVKWCVFKGVQRIWSFVATPFPATEWRANQEVSECSHQNIDNPLLLDKSVSKKDFKKIMLKIRRIENIFKIKKVFSLLRSKWRNFQL